MQSNVAAQLDSWHRAFSRTTVLSLYRNVKTGTIRFMVGILERVVMWRNLDSNGIERCELRRTSNGYALIGTVLGVLTERHHPVEARYEIRCDMGWRTHRVHIDQFLDRESESLSLSVEACRRWREHRRERPDLAECVDVDLSITPATNILPIRRLALGVGQRQQLIAAWVKFPELEVQPLKQTYTRLSNSAYRYEDASGFSADLQVDDLGLAVTYPGGWQRLASS